MRVFLKFLIVTFALTAHTLTSSAPERKTVVGLVTDKDGKPLENALVVVFQAVMKTGLRTPCPTCYPDCAKWSLTGPDGKYTISGLDPNLIFSFVVAKDGYWGPGVRGVDPMIGPASRALQAL
jgi:hypothetical protein